MDLLECFFETDIWESVINKGVDKTIPPDILQKFSRAEERLNLLQKIISGEYRISPPKVSRVPKDSGGFREIYVNSPQDRVILAAINQAYYRLFEARLSPACKAYRENSSCGKVVREVASQKIKGYKLDLSKYFDSVPIDVINKALDELDTGSPLDSVVRDYYNTDIVLVDGQEVNRFKSLAQGCAIASFLSNYILKDIDKEMTQMCTYYCRYSDDIVIIADNPDAVLSRLTEMLSSLQLHLNPAKIERIDSLHEFKFLGFGVTGSKISISQKDFSLKKREVKSVCALIGKDRKLTKEEKLQKLISEVQKIFFCKTNPCHGWLYGKAAFLTDIERVAALDMFCKEHIRAAITGRWNFTSNIHKITEQDLRGAGYVSLVHMAKMAKLGRDIYQQEHFLHIEQRMPVAAAESVDSFSST